MFYNRHPLVKHLFSGKRSDRPAPQAAAKATGAPPTAKGDAKVKRHRILSHHYLVHCNIARTGTRPHVAARALMSRHALTRLQSSSNPFAALHVDSPTAEADE